MEYCLTTAMLCKQYKSFKALNGLTMHVPKGAIYGLVGRNGAGKTTLIRLIAGIQEPTSGEYTLYGVKNTDREIHKARRHMGAVVETPSIYMDMSAEENLKIQYHVLGLPNYEGIPELLQLADLDDCGKKKAKYFSLGMRQRLGIAVALCGSPDFLVLDEPVNGLDPQGIVEIRELILRLNQEQQITILISSHILDELSKLATHYGFVDRGAMVREVSAAELDAACRKCIRLSVTDAGVFTLLSMLIDNKAISATVCMVLYVVLFLGAPFLQTAVFSYYHGASLNHMPGEFIRPLLEFLYDFLPVGQELQISGIFIHLYRLPVYSVICIALTTVCGMAVFSKKDLK